MVNKIFWEAWAVIKYNLNTYGTHEHGLPSINPKNINTISDVTFFKKHEAFGTSEKSAI